MELETLSRERGGRRKIEKEEVEEDNEEEEECINCASDYCSDPQKDNGRKIKDGIENPVSTLFLRVNDPLLRPMARAGISANMLTFFSLITGLLAVYFVWVRKPFIGALFYAASYFFDCSDGCMARYTNTCSEFGDKFDHYKDITVFILLIVAIQVRYPPGVKWWGIFGGLLGLSLIHFGSVERFNRLSCGKDHPKNFLNMFSMFSQWVSPGDDCEQLVKTMKVSRWFGDGSLIFAVVIYLFICEFNENKGKEERRSGMEILIC